MEQFLLPNLRGVLSRPCERHLVCIDDGVYASGLLLELPENDVAAPVVLRRRLNVPRSARGCVVGGRGIPVGSRTRLGEADTADGIRFRRNRVGEKLVLLWQDLDQVRCTDVSSPHFPLHLWEEETTGEIIKIL